MLCRLSKKFANKNQNDFLSYLFCMICSSIYSTPSSREWLMSSVLCRRSVFNLYSFRWNQSWSSFSLSLKKAFGWNDPKRGLHNWNSVWIGSSARNIDMIKIKGWQKGIKWISNKSIYVQFPKRREAFGKS